MAPDESWGVLRPSHCRFDFDNKSLCSKCWEWWKMPRFSDGGLLQSLVRAWAKWGCSRLASWYNNTSQAARAPAVATTTATSEANTTATIKRGNNAKNRNSINTNIKYSYIDNNQIKKAASTQQHFATTTTISNFKSFLPALAIGHSSLGTRQIWQFLRFSQILHSRWNMGQDGTRSADPVWSSAGVWFHGTLHPQKDYLQSDLWTTWTTILSILPQPLHAMTWLFW